jgi:glutaconyl-CoA/methylmalonyl-CoA decarboxylase subunit gamma
MKYTVIVEEQTFEVEISDLNARPVIVLVDGEAIEVWPEGSSPAHLPTGRAARPAGGKNTPGQAVKSGNGAGPAGKNGTSVLGVVKAPIPGVIIQVDVKAGDEVQAGQQLCVLEAMKMNNSIRSARAGTVAAVHVTVGQQVKHGQLLVEFTE